MFPRTTETAFARFQKTGEAKALAIVFDRTAPELIKVARHLAAVPSDAEDLVQATFLTAIESASTHERGRPVLPWLLGVLANHAREHRRRARRQPDPSRLRGDVVADVATEVSDRELREELDRSLAKLPDAYRPVLRLWLEHGLEANEIAATLERPAGTVRAQISRGLDLLRRALPPSLAGGAALNFATGRGLAAVRQQVLGKCVGTSTGIASALTFGGLLMLHHKVMTAGVVLAVALVSWFALGPALAGVPPLADEHLAAGVASGGVERPSVNAATEPLARDVVPQLPAEPGVKPEVLAASPTVLVVRLVGMTSRAPVAGYSVALRPEDGLGNLALALDYQVTDQAGVARFVGIEAGTWFIEVARFGSAGGANVAAGETVEQVIDLPDTVTVEGEVVDPSGLPAAGAEIVVQGSQLSSPRVAVTDAQGRFTVTHLLRVELQARKPGYSPSLSHAVQGAAGERLQLRLQLGEAGRRIRGRVLDVDGETVAGAVVAVVPDAARQVTPWDRGKPMVRPIWLRSDRNGRFATDQVAAGKYLVVARAADVETTPSWADVDVTAFDAEVELRSALPTVIEGSIRRGGQPVPDAEVVVWPEKCAADIGYLLNLIGMRKTVTAADGTFRIIGTLPGELVIRAMDGSVSLGEARREVAAGGIAQWHCDSGAANELSILVSGEVPLPRVLMAFIRDQSVPNGAPGMVPVMSGRATYKRAAQAEVAVTLAMLPGGRSMMQLAQQMVAAAEAEVRFELRAEQLPVRKIRGRLVDGVRAPIGNRPVSLRRIGGELVVYLEGTTAADGTFEFGPVPAGEYAVATGQLVETRIAGQALVTAARDEDLGDLVITK